MIPPTDACLNRLALEYTYEDILRATDNFSSNSQLGKGTYGSVYRGSLRDGTNVLFCVLLYCFCVIFFIILLGSIIREQISSDLLIPIC